ncbi:MAG: ABC transporter substrate-binding protein [Bacteroidota bacterium]
MLRRSLLIVLSLLLFQACAKKEESKKLSVLVSPKGLEHAFWLTVKAGADSAGKEFSVDVIWRGPTRETDVPTQISILEDYINEKVDAIVLAATDAKGIIPYVQKALSAKIPVITIDSGVESDLPLSFVATDNIAAAQRAAQALAELIGDTGEVACIPFVPGAATSVMREQGFCDEIKNHPRIRLVALQYSQSDVATAMAVTEDILTAHHNLAGIFGANEASALGIMQAIKNRGLAGKVKVVGFDASDNEIQALRDGLVQALIVQDPFKMGYLGVRYAVDAVHGKVVPKRVDTGVYVVTRENLDSLEIQKLLHPFR